MILQVGMVAGRAWTPGDRIEWRLPDGRTTCGQVLFVPRQGEKDGVLQVASDSGFVGLVPACDVVQ